jgi:polysaccharide pyruvyl transferase CsaB
VRLLLSGYYGFGNLGDDALLDVIVSELRVRHPELVLEVLTNEPDATRHALRVETTLRSDLAAVRKAIDRSDVVVSGGGGLLQNATSLRSLMYYGGIVRRATAVGKRTMIFAQSVGPLDFVGRQVVRTCCRGVTAATVRDARSQVLLAKLLPGVDVVRTADPVFLYDPAEPTDEQLTAQGIGPGGDPLVVVSVRSAPGFSSAGAARVAEAVDRLSEAHGAQVAFVPFGGVPDADVATAVMRRCRSKPTLLPVADIGSVAAILSRAQLLIGMRLHALILAVRLGVPFIAIPYDPKVAGLCEELAYPLGPLWEPGTAGRNAASAADLADEAWRRRDELGALLRDARVVQRARAEENFTVLERVLAA